MPRVPRFATLALPLCCLLAVVLASGCADSAPGDAVAQEAAAPAAAPAAPAAPPAAETAGAPAPVLLPVDTAILRQAIADRQGRKALVVNMWATWCGPCVEEFPAFVDIAKAHPETLDVVFVSHDFPGTEDVVLEFLQEHGVTWPSYQLTQQAGQDFFPVLSDAWTGALPATLVVSRDGTRVAFHEGEIDAATLQADVARALAP